MLFFLGNIRVFCRIRPVIKEDRIDAGKRSVVCCDQDDNSCVIVENKDRKLKFDCDRVFDQTSTQQEVRRIYFKLTSEVLKFSTYWYF